jgi:ketosteroid isomerase-like protein
VSHSPTSSADEQQIRTVLLQWAEATREDRRDEVLANHLPHALIYDVLPPMKYEGTEAYRASWDEWQPDTAAEARFELEDLTITATADLAFAHGFIRCGGAMPNGETFEDLVRATFCLEKSTGSWKIAHQHISKPFEPKSTKP